MISVPGIEIRSEVAAAWKEKQGVVALESTLISHGLPWPVNLETARGAETAVREEGAISATVAVIRGRPTIGLSDAELETMAKEEGLLKASRRDLAAAAEASIHGPALTPFLLARLAEITRGQTVRANQALIAENARLAARIAKAICTAG